MSGREDETDIETRSTGSEAKDAVLLVRAGDRTDAIRLEDGRTIVIGRGADADIVVDHAKASRAHASIRLRAGVLVVEDLGSRNGTRVNDRVLRGESTVLRSGDRIYVGATEVLAAVPERRAEGRDFLEVELAQMVAARGGAVVLVRVAFAHTPEEEVLDAVDREVGEQGFVVPGSERELYALVAGVEPRAIAERVRRVAPSAQVSTAAHPSDGSTARVLLKAAERAAGATLTERPDTIVADPVMLKVYEVVRRIAPVPTTALLLGETGVGKEVVAETLHRSSPRADGPFIKINCGALPENLLESELFGHEKGAFTGADRTKIGLFEAATGGTIFLDEIGEMSATAQVRLLRVLESRRLTRLGSTAEIPIDVRVVCATHRDLPALVEAGTFRSDLYYRVATTTLRIPPLRERPLELTLLARSFADAASARAGLPPASLGEDVMKLLQAHPFPGNVRELKNAMDHAVVMAGGGPIGASHLPESIGGDRPRAAALSPVRQQVADAEKKAVLDALAKTGGNRTHAAALLGVSRRTLVYKLARYGIGRAG